MGARTDRLLHGSPLRRPAVAIWISLALAAVIAFVALEFLWMLGSMRPDVASVFLIALASARVMSTVPLALLWFLDRRERETPWLFAAAFLWGGFIATGLALPFNTAFFTGGRRLARAAPGAHASARPRRGRADRRAALRRRSSRRSPRRSGCVLLFWLLRAEFDNMRDGFVYGALVGVGFHLVRGADLRRAGLRRIRRRAVGLAARLALRAVRARRTRAVHRHLRRLARARAADAAPLAAHARAARRARARDRSRMR